MTFLGDLKFAARSLSRTKGLALTVVLTLALGIGANSAIFTLVRGVLLRPLINRDEDRLIYIRQSAKGIGAENAAFSVPEIQDLRQGVDEGRILGDADAVGIDHDVLDRPPARRGDDVEDLRMDGRLAARDLHQVGLAFARHQGVQHALDLGEAAMGGAPGR